VRGWRPWFTDTVIEPPTELIVDLVMNSMVWAALDLYYTLYRRGQHVELGEVERLCGELGVDCGEFIELARSGGYVRGLMHVGPITE